MSEQIVDLLSDGAALDAEIKAKTARLREIKDALAEAAAFKAGSSTGYVIGGGIRAKVITGVNRTWDQGRLLEIKARKPEEFADLFAPKYEPVGKRAIDTALQAGGEMALALRWAMEEKPKAPTVTFEFLQEEVSRAA